MGGLVDAVFGGGDDASDAVVSSNAQTNAQIAQNLDKTIKFLQGSKLISGGGINSFNRGGRLVVQPTGRRTQLTNRLSSDFNRTARSLRGLRSQVRPGFGNLSRAVNDVFSARKADLADSRRRVVGDVRDNLARRRLAGSSFASDAVVRAEREFERQENELASEEALIQAQTFLQELDTQAELIERESEFSRGAIETLITELNLETEIALQLTGLANNGISSLASAQTSALTSLGQSNANAILENQSQASSLQTGLLGFGLSFI